MITMATLEAIAPQGNRDLMAKLVGHLQRATKDWSNLRVAHFLAQAAHETDGFRTLQEYGGPGYWKRYEGRKDLGNVNPGDGVKYHGRGIFQLTGRANYVEFGKTLGLDLVSNPDRVLEPGLAVETAVAYWRKRKLDAWADRDDVKEITRRINGGQNGLEDRKRYLRRAKQLLPSDAAPAEPSDDIAPDAPIAAEPVKKWWESTTILGAVTSALGGMAAAFKGMFDGIDTPWEFASFALLLGVIAAGAAWVIRERLRRNP